MAQPPFKTDVLQIEPAASGVRTIDRDSTQGELRFTDPSFPSGVVLAQLVGVQTIPSTFVVGTGGGAQYTTIQAAIDALPTTGSVTNPQVILVFPGTYSEKLTIDKDGVVLVGQGFVRIVNNDADPTIHVVQGSVTQIPRFVRLVNLALEAEDDGATCLYLDGSSTFATGSFTIATAPLAAGDVLTIGGLNLTGIAGGRTSGADNFNCTLGSTAALAAEIVAALNDPSNSFAATVTAALDGSDVDLTAVVPGSGGNVITLAATTVPPGGITPIGATLTGGGGQGSLVGMDGIEVLQCDFAATGIGSKQIVADTVNRVTVSGGTWQGSSSTSLSTVAQTAFFSLNGVEWMNGLEVAYDSGQAEPDDVPDGWVMQNVGRAGTLLINLVGAGYTFITGCPLIGHTTHNGDRTFRAVGSVFGDMLVEDTVAATLINCARGTLGGTGTGTVQETSVVGTVPFVASALEVITFPVAQPNAGYTVVLDVPSISVTAGVTSRTAAGFTVETSALYTGSIGYNVLRQLT